MTIRETLFRGQSIYENFPYDPSKVDLQGWGGTHNIFDRSIKKIRPKLIIEVGTWKGQSAITMATTLKNNNIAGEIICVDTWLGSAEHWLAEDSRLLWFESLNLRYGYPSLYMTFINNVIHSGLQNYITPLPLTSEAAYHVLKKYNVKADLVYIDAAHDYQSVKQDISLYWNLVDNGIMILDDYSENKSKGVVEAACEFVAENKLFLQTVGPTKAIITTKGLKFRVE